jgi:hypothetical protein
LERVLKKDDLPTLGRPTIPICQSDSAPTAVAHLQVVARSTEDNLLLDFLLLLGRHFTGFKGERGRGKSPDKCGRGATGQRGGCYSRAGPKSKEDGTGEGLARESRDRRGHAIAQVTSF